MALNLNKGTVGSPIVKWDSRSGRFFRVDRTKSASGEFTSNMVELPKAIAVMDLERLEVGWIGFPANKPDFRMVPLGQDMGPQPASYGDRPQDVYNSGFRVYLKLAPSQDGGEPVRVFTHTAAAVCTAFDALHDQYLAAPESKQGLLPVVVVEGGELIKSKNGSTNYAPRFTIAKWVPRPPELVPVQAAANGNGHATGAANGNGGSAASAPDSNPMDDFDGVPVGADVGAGAAGGAEDDDLPF